MKIKLSIVYLVLLVLGIIGAGFLTGVYGENIGIWVSYSFLAFYGMIIMVLLNMVEKIASVKVEVEGELTPEQASSLPNELGKEKKVGETTLEERDVPPEPPIEPPKELPEPTEEPEEEKVKLSQEDIARIKKVATYIQTNLEKGHSLEKIRGILEKAYTKEFIDFVLGQFKEPELPDLGEPDNKPKKKRKGRPKKKKEIVDPEDFK